MDTLGFAEVNSKHNQGPELLSGEALRYALSEHNDAMTQRRDELVAAESRIPEIDGDDAAGKVSDYIKQITAAIKATDGARIAAKEPYLEGSRIVDGFFTKGISDVLSALKKRVEGKLTKYLQDKAAKERAERVEAERIARAAEDAARQAAEASAKAARTDADLDRAISAETTANEAAAARIAAENATNAKAAELSRTRGDYGSVASLRTSWEFEITDVAAIPREFMMVNEAAIKAHMKARLKDQPPAPVAGVRFYEKTAAAVR